MDYQRDGQGHVPFSAIEAARERIKDVVRLTPVTVSPSLSERMGVPVSLKCEHHQLTGAFKLRGAANAVRQLSSDEIARGVLAISTGNHGRGVAAACRVAGVSCTVVMADTAPQVKRDGIRALGADVVIHGHTQAEAEEKATELLKERGSVMLHPFDHPHVIEGQGTLGIEIVEQCPDMALLAVCLSGGGLLAGVAKAVKTLRPEVRIVGVSHARGPAMIESVRAGRLVDVVEERSLADSLAGGLGATNNFSFRMVRDLVDDYVTVTEHEIADAMRHAYFKEHEIVEGGGAVCLAAALSGKLPALGPTTLLVSGRNVDMDLHHMIMSGGMPAWL